jgi:sugar fermentation stimulation protein
LEVKGCTLENEGVASFPDAPTERGVKHISELCEAVRDGYEAYVFFVIQMKECKYFTPNTKTHPAFAEALKHASENGVTVKAVCCNVTENSLEIADFADVML